MTTETDNAGTAPAPSARPSNQQDRPQQDRQQDARRDFRRGANEREIVVNGNIFYGSLEGALARFVKENKPTLNEYREREFYVGPKARRVRKSARHQRREAKERQKQAAPKE